MGEDRPGFEPPVEGLGRRAAAAGTGAAVSKAIGTSSARQLLSRHGTSDGSAGGDARELASHTKAGADIGAKLGNVPGAAVGAGVGAVIGAAKNKRNRRRIASLLAVPFLAWLLILTVLTVVITSQATTGSAVEERARSIAVTDGVSAGDLQTYLAAADSSGVQWPVLAAVDRSAGGWSSPGNPPYGIADLDAFNADLTEHRFDPLTPEQATDRVAAGYAYGRLLAAEIVEADRRVDPGRIDAGAGIQPNPHDPAAQLRGVDDTDTDAVASHQATQNAFSAALAAMPSATAGDATTIFEAAYLWSIGQSRCAGESFSGTGDGTVPQPSGTGPRLDVKVASWNVYYFTRASQTTAGLRALTGTADVIGLQEFGPSRKQRAVLGTLPAGWTAYTTPGNMTGIAWRTTKFDLVEQGVEQSIGFERVENGGSGTGIGPRYTLWVTLKQKDTGAVFTEINTHLIPSIDRGGHPDDTKPKRLAAADQQLEQVGKLTSRFTPRGAVFVTGDFNIEAKADARVRDPRWPQAKLQRYGLYSNWRALGYPLGGGTHGGDRYIDYVWSTAALAAPTAETILSKFGSDHSPVVVTESSTPRSSTSPGGGPAASNDAADLAATSSSPTSSTGASGPLPSTLTVPGVTLRGEQVTNAAIIIAEGKAAKIPPQGWVVALAAAFQESGVKNLDYGDRDSQGMFQQRPSSGWGTPAQIRDPHLATRAFYGVAEHTTNPGLVDVPNWQALSVSEAAQKVQRSAFPDAYARHEAAARSVVEQLTGQVSADSSSSSTSSGAGCAAAGAGAGGGLPGDCPPTPMPAEKVLTPDALRVLRCVAAKWPAIQSIGTYPGHEPDESRAVDIMIPDYQSAQGRALGTEISRWVHDNAKALGVQYLIYWAQIWNVERDGEGWRAYSSITGHNDDSSLHYNHVHVSVYGDQGTGFAPTAGAPLAAGKWTAPMAPETYRVGCGFQGWAPSGVGCYSSHTGQDFPAHSGTPVYATNAGTVVRSVALQSRGRYVSYGNLVVIKAAGEANTQVYYAHLKQRMVTTGQQITAGQQIGLSGYTGHVNPQGEGGAHLHYEVRVGGTPVNPLPLLKQHGVTP